MKLRNKHLALALASLSALAPFNGNAADLGDLPFSSGSTGADGAFAPILLGLEARGHMPMVFDSERNEIVLFGGYRNSYPNAWDETYTSSGTGGTLKSPAQRPQARYGLTMAFDSARKRVVIHGGYANNYGYFADTWVWDGTTWTQATTSGPGGRHFSQMAFDSVRNQAVLFGGYNGNYFGDTWLWDGSNWQQSSPTTQPPARHAGSMAFDSARGEIVMFGGQGANNAPLGDTWVWNGSNWTQKTPTTSPSPRLGYAQFAVDPANGDLILFGGHNGTEALNDTWAWNGTTWTKKNPLRKPTPRYSGAMAPLPASNGVMLVGGYSKDGSPISDQWLWTGGDWKFLSGRTVWVDMNEKADGTWNFTTIDVPVGMDIYFLKNSANTPVRWKATGAVNIMGALNLNGANATTDNTAGHEAIGGPGGFAGGLGGLRYDQSGSYAGTPGQGPGGGAPGVSPSATGGAGGYNGVYGNAFIQPLVGGSGGGGGASSQTSNGGNGGGGGGAIFISSSRDITINGAIRAWGGDASPIASWGGAGSGGAIRLAADRIFGSGSLETHGNGRIRLEGYYRTFNGGSNPAFISSAPVAGGEVDSNAKLRVSSVAGQNVVQPPRGDTFNPDVIFSDAGEVTVGVQSEGIPDGTPVTLRITSDGQIITKPAQGDAPVTLASGVASFKVVVPRGVGTVQAYAQYTIRR